jgi:hypothetical protein
LGESLGVTVVVVPCNGVSFVAGTVDSDIEGVSNGTDGGSTWFGVTDTVAVKGVSDNESLMSATRLAPGVPSLSGIAVPFPAVSCWEYGR